MNMSSRRGTYLFKGIALTLP